MIIDKGLVFVAGSYTFRNFISLTEEEKIKVWNWRNEESRSYYEFKHPEARPEIANDFDFD